MPYALKYNGTIYYYVVNVQGDVLGLVDSNGITVATYEYDPYGKIIPSATTTAIGELNPLRYRSYIYDQESGLYYLQSRYYDPETGRFINADNYPTTGQGLLGNNMFAYCNNSPIQNLDSTGTYCRDAAVEYIKEWRDKKNKEYYYYRRGDCANFVSQGLRAGGIGDSDGWYHSKSKKSFLEMLP